MPFAVILDFDPKTEATVRECWQRLSQRGISTSMPGSGVRPHVTLSVADMVQVEEFQSWLRTFAVQIRPFDVLLQSIGLFPTAEGVVYFAPTVTQTLLDIHRGFHEAQPPSWRDLRPYYLPGRWVPHCTAATGLSREEITAAVAICMETPLPLAGRFDAITLIEIHPQQPIREIETILFNR